MMEHVYAAGDQLRWAASLPLPTVPQGAEVVLAGMGGSGMAARVGALVVPTIPITIEQGYELPAWADARRPVVVAVSYSGNTEETLSAVAGAHAAGLDLIAVTTGGALASLAAEAGFPVVSIPAGLQPRAALAYQAGAVARVLAAVTGVADPVADLTFTADLIDGLLAGGDGPAAGLGRDLADGLYGRIAVIYGGRGVGAVAAARWKAQINENAKMPAFASEIPELNHNELEGWGALPELGKRIVGLVTLSDPRSNDRIQRRMRLTTDVLDDRVDHVGDVIAQGDSALSRFFSLTVVGDVASVALAEMAGVDPTPVALLEDFKKRLRED